MNEYYFKILNTLGNCVLLAQMNISFVQGANFKLLRLAPAGNESSVALTQEPPKPLSMIESQGQIEAEQATHWNEQHHRADGHYWGY